MLDIESTSKVRPHVSIQVFLDANRKFVGTATTGGTALPECTPMVGMLPTLDVLIDTFACFGDPDPVRISGELRTNTPSGEVFDRFPDLASNGTVVKSGWLFPPIRRTTAPSCIAGQPGCLSNPFVGKIEGSDIWDLPTDVIATDGSGNPDLHVAAHGNIMDYGVYYEPQLLTLALKPQRGAGPIYDTNWAKGTHTAEWRVETTNDQKPDFLIRTVVDAAGFDTQSRYRECG